MQTASTAKHPRAKPHLSVVARSRWLVPAGGLAARRVRVDRLEVRHGRSGLRQARHGRDRRRRPGRHQRLRVARRWPPAATSAACPGRRPTDSARPGPSPSLAARPRRTRAAGRGAAPSGEGGGSLTCASIAAPPSSAANGGSPVRPRRAGSRARRRRRARRRDRSRDLLGRHVLGARDDRSLPRQPAGVGGAAWRGRSRSGTRGRRAREQHVGRLDVAVHQAARVGGVERGRRPGGRCAPPGAGSTWPSAAISARRSVPSTSRIVMKSTPSSSPASSMGMTFGWSIEAATFDSRRKRSRKRSSWECSGRISLRATGAAAPAPRRGRRRPCLRGRSPPRPGIPRTPMPAGAASGQRGRAGGGGEAAVAAGRPAAGGGARRRGPAARAGAGPAGEAARAAAGRGRAGGAAARPARPRSAPRSCAPSRIESPDLELPCGSLDPLAVDERAVRRPEVLDRQPSAGAAGDARVAARQLRVVAEPPSPLSARPITNSSASAIQAALSAPTVDHAAALRRAGGGPVGGSRPAGSALGDAARGVCHLQERLAHPHDVPSVQRARALDPLVVDERPVGGSEILDAQLAVDAAPGARVAARDLGVVAEPSLGLVGGATDQQRRRPPPGARPRPCPR